MQFGIFTVGDVTPDPTTGRTPTEHERIKATVDDREEGRGGRPRRLRDRRAPQPAVHRLRADDHAGLHRRADRADHPVDGDHADHHHRPGADRGELRQAPAPHRRPRRPDDGPRQHRPGLPVVRQGHPPGHQPRDRELRAAAPAVARGRRRLGGPVPHAAAGLHLDAAAAGRRRRRSSGTARSAAPRSPSRRPTTATGSSTTTSSGRPRTPSRWSTSTGAASSTTATAPPTRRSSAWAGSSSCARNSQDAVNEFRPYFDNAPVYGHGPSLEDFTEADPADRRLAAAGARAHAGVPRLRRRLPAPAVPGRPRRPAAEDRARAARPARRDPARAAQRASPRAARRTSRTPPPTPRWSPRPAAPRTPPCTPRRRRHRHRAEDAEEVRHDLARRRLRRAQRALVDPAARRPARRRDGRGAGRGRGRRIVELRDARARSSPTTCSPASPAGELAAAIDDGTPRRRPDRGHAGVLGVVLRAVQDVLRRPRGRARWTASRCWSPRPPAPPGTRWCSSTRCARCSPTCTRSSCPTGVFAATDDFGDTGLDAPDRARRRASWPR